MPASKEMMRHEAKAGDDHEGVADPDGVGKAPESLPDHLRVAGYPNDPGLPEVHLINQGAAAAHQA